MGFHAQCLQAATPPYALQFLNEVFGEAHPSVRG